MSTGTSQISPEMRLLEKRAAQAAMQEAARPITERIDAHGKVRVWSLSEEKYFDLWPIDAREQLAAGGVLLDRPEDDDEPEGEDAIPEPPEPVNLKELRGMTARSVKEYADKLGIIEHDNVMLANMRKDEVIKAIVAKQDIGDAE